jgi:hypothetical protein
MVLCLWDKVLGVQVQNAICYFGFALAKEGGQKMSSFLKSAAKGSGWSRERRFRKVGIKSAPSFSFCN